MQLFTNIHLFIYYKHIFNVIVCTTLLYLYFNYGMLFIIVGLWSKVSFLIAVYHL